MKKGQLKLETVRILEALFSEALAYYDLYLLKKNNKRLEAEKLESILVPKWEEGLRADIRAYFDEV